MYIGIGLCGAKFVMPSANGGDGLALCCWEEVGGVAADEERGEGWPPEEDVGGVPLSDGDGAFRG